MTDLYLIHSEDFEGFITNGYYGGNNLAFVINLPKNAAVDYIRIRGEFDIKGVGKQKDKLLNDIECSKKIEYHREFMSGEQRIVATIEFPEGIPNDLYEKVMSDVINKFDVYYHLEAVTEA
jgi:hypothetical protein